MNGHHGGDGKEPAVDRRGVLQAAGTAGIGGLAGIGGMAATPATADDEISADDFEPPERAQLYHTATASSFDTLNPLYNTEAGAAEAIGLALDQGYTFDDNGDLFPLHYDMSTQNGSVWVLDLREDLKFSDPYGQVTAEDFVYQIQELHMSDWANTADKTSWTKEMTVTKTGKFQFQVELPDTKLLWPETYEPLLYPIPKSLVEPYVQNEDASGLRKDSELRELQFTGNLGAYTLDTWEQGSGTEYSRNDNYYLRNLSYGPELFTEAPYFEQAKISRILERSSRLAALKNSEIERAFLPESRVDEFKAIDDITVLQQRQPYNQIISVNMRDNGWNAGPGNLFRYKEFRQALAGAISKEKLISEVYDGLARPHHTWQPRFSNWYPGDDEIPQFGSGSAYGETFAKDKAKEAFDKADLDYYFSNGVLKTPDGSDVQIDLYYSKGQNTERRQAEFVASELDTNLGISVDVKAIDATTFQSDYWTMPPEGGSAEIDGEIIEWDSPSPVNGGPRSVTSEKSWDMSMAYGLNTFPRYPITNHVFFDGPTTDYNPVGYYPGFDARSLFEQARNATSRDELTQAVQTLFTHLAEEQPYIMLAFKDDVMGYNSDLVHDGPSPSENFASGWDNVAWYYDSDGLPPVIGNNQAQDLDDDGLYEDVNGDGAVDIFDVQLLFENIDSDAVQQHSDLFNFSGQNPDEVDIFDVQALFERV